MDHLNVGYEHDPELSAALRDTYGDAPEIDFAALRGAVMARAELPLARMRRGQRKSPWPARFRAFVPLAAAAGVVGTAFALGVQMPGTHRTPHDTVTEAERAQVEQILNESLPTVDQLVGGNDQLLTAVGS
jgi:hypothetical protein